MDPNWARSLRDQCLESGTPFLFKQWGDWHYCQEGHQGKMMMMETWEPKRPMYRVGKKKAGRVLDGRTWDQYPEASQ